MFDRLSRGWFRFESRPRAGNECPPCPAPSAWRPGNKARPYGSVVPSCDGAILPSESVRAQCLLSSSYTLVDLVGYCDFKSMLSCRLGKDIALVLASSWTTSVSSHPCVTVEFMQKVSDISLLILKANLGTEWNTALTRTPADNSDPHLLPNLNLGPSLLASFTHSLASASSTGASRRKLPCGDTKHC